jgi:protease I
MELHGKRVAILIAEHYEDLEVWYPLLRLREAGAEVTTVGTGAASYASKHGLPLQADTRVAEIQANDFDAFIISSLPDAEVFANHPAMTALVHAAMQQGKVVAATAAAGRLLATAREGEEAQTRQLFETHAEVVQDDGPFKDSAVIREGNLILARTPVDPLAFCRMIMAALAAAPTPPTAAASPAARAIEGTTQH